jgi:hypothetical protein
MEAPIYVCETKNYKLQSALWMTGAFGRATMGFSGRREMWIRVGKEIAFTLERWN